MKYFNHRPSPLASHARRPWRLLLRRVRLVWIILAGCSLVAVAQPTADTVQLRQMGDSLLRLARARDSLRLLADSLIRRDSQPAAILFRGARASADISRGVVAGGMVALRLSQPVPLTMKPTVSLTRRDGGAGEAGVTTRMEIEEYLDSALVIRVPDSLPNGSYEVNIAVPGAAPDRLESLLRPQILKVEKVGWILLFSFIPIILLAALIGYICVGNKTPQGQARYNAWKLLFLEPRNQTYSLSRAQFVAWMIAISSAYMFLFIARGLVESIWAFPPLGGFGITFLISLGTLVAAQATSSIKGAKGSGEIHPSIADLVVHGGVLALERVQQVLWTMIAIGMFLWIVYKSYTASTELPTIPNELLYLMGISSAGYIVGKAARKPGPIITAIAASGGSVYLTVEGQNISKDASIWVDGTQLPQKAAVLTADPDAPNEFARELRVMLTDASATLAGWYGASHNVVVVNADGQRSEWQSVPTIVSVAAGPPVAGQVTLRVEGSYIGDTTAWEFTGAQLVAGTRPMRDPVIANIWRVTVEPLTAAAAGANAPAGVTAAGSQPFTSITLRDPNKKESTYKWKG